jgi:hypothetical protein
MLKKETTFKVKVEKIYFSKNLITNYSRLIDRLSLRKNLRELNRPGDKI